MDARLLGPVTLAADGATMPAGGANGRALLAALLLSPGRPVAVEQLVLDIWGDAAPVRARARLRPLVSQLRGQLSDLDEAVTVTRHAQIESYSLDIDPESVDVTRFIALTEQGGEALAAGRPGQAHELLERALACWSGPALSGVRAYGRLQAERRRLEELRLEALALSNDADLRLDRPAAVIPGLRALVAEFPGNERFRAQLAEALVRSGRVAQAWELGQEQPARTQEQPARTTEQPARTTERAADRPVEASSEEEPDGHSTAVAVRLADSPPPVVPRPTSAGAVPAVSGEPRISLLGPVRAWRGTTEVSLGSPQQQAVLGMLAAQLGQQISTQELIDGLWGDRPPPQAIAALHTYVSRLRSVLESAREVRRPASVLVSVSDGYELRLPRRAVDLQAFEDGLAEARSAQGAGDHAAAVRVAGAALALWHGSEPLAGLPGPHAEMVRNRLTENRIAAFELRIEAQLALGAGSEVIAELSELTSQYPLRERLRELLMIALYRAGRQAEALGVYAETRKLLVEELGVEPGAGLAELHVRVLAADPVLRPDPTAGYRHAESVAPPLPALPAQLPADVSDFIGRHALVRELQETLRGGSGQAVEVVVLAGIGGMGKTTLAVHVAHSVRSEFPDGQLHADLRGTGLTPADPAVVLGDFLYALGVPEPPDSYDQRVALFRSLLADRRMLVLLDDASDAEQVRPLIPGGSGSAVLLTSRSRLAGLAGAQLYDVEELTPQEALALFAAVAGRYRVEAEPEAALAVVTACGFLPLAVRIAAALLAGRPRWTVTDLARRLADQRRRFDELQLGSLAVETVIGRGYGRLSPEEARAFRLLSLVDTPDLPLYAIAALLGVEEDRAEDLAESLVEANMLETHVPGRYRFHDLLRLYAQRRNEHVGDVEEQTAALRRLLDLLLATVRSAVRELEPGDELPDPLHEPSVSALAPEGGSRGIRDWLDSARSLTLGAIDAAFSTAGLARPAVDLMVALTAVLGDWGVTHRLRAMLDSAATTSRHQEDLALLARIRYVQGDLCLIAGEYQEGEAAFRESLALQGPTDVTRLRAIVSVRLAVVLATTGRSGEALPLYQQALEISRGSSLSRSRVS